MKKEYDIRQQEINYLRELIDIKKIEFKTKIEKLKGKKLK
jgi:acyl-CoA thioesterase FadM